MPSYKDNLSARHAELHAETRRRVVALTDPDDKGGVTVDLDEATFSTIHVQDQDDNALVTYRTGTTTTLYDLDVGDLIKLVGILEEKFPE